MRLLGVLRPSAAFAASLVLSIAFAISPAAATDAPAPNTAPSKPGATAPCTCPGEDKPMNHWPRPRLADASPAQAPFDAMDEIAALEAIRVALTEVGDGGSYVWHRTHGRLSGFVTPTSSFKDAAGNVCRHIIAVLTAGGTSRRTEGFACRLPDGRWQLDG
jgi:hypothetical protein